MNQENKTKQRIKSDTFLKFILDHKVKSDTEIEILQLVHQRRFNNITQDYMAKSLQVSVATIKRFEKFKVDSLTMYLNYKTLLEGLPTREKVEVPKWVYGS